MLSKIQSGNSGRTGSVCLIDQIGVHMPSQPRLKDPASGDFAADLTHQVRCLQVEANRPAGAGVEDFYLDPLDFLEIRWGIERLDAPKTEVGQRRPVIRCL